MQTNVHNKNGELSRYGFGCGYQMTESNGENSKSIYLEHGVYVIVAFIDGVSEYGLSHNLAEARKIYKSIKL